jgi:hypothetical protein
MFATCSCSCSCSSYPLNSPRTPRRRRGRSSRCFDRRALSFPHWRRRRRRCRFHQLHHRRSIQLLFRFCLETLAGCIPSFAGELRPNQVPPLISKKATTSLRVFGRMHPLVCRRVTTSLRVVGRMYPLVCRRVMTSLRPHLIAHSNEQVSSKYGSVIQVSKVSLHIPSTRFSVTLESGTVNDSPVSSVSAVFLSPEITRILSKQCPLTSPSQSTRNVNARDVLASITGILFKQYPLTLQSKPTCNVDALDVPACR